MKLPPLPTIHTYKLLSYFYFLAGKPREAFTLIELMVVISLVGIFLAIGSLSFSQISKRQDVLSAANNLRNNLLVVQTNANNGVIKQGTLGCSGDSVEGWALKFTNSTNFGPIIKCSNQRIPNTSEVNSYIRANYFPSNVTVSTPLTDVMFLALNKGIYTCQDITHVNQVKDNAGNIDPSCSQVTGTHNIDVTNGTQIYRVSVASGGVISVTKVN